VGRADGAGENSLEGGAQKEATPGPTGSQLEVG
jgi:hypothetical protein